MEGNNHSTVLEKPVLEKIPFVRSTRFRMLMFGTVLLIYGILFSILFSWNSERLSGNMRDTVSLQSLYYGGYSVLDPMHLNLNNYLNLYDEEYLERYEENKTEFMDFIQLLKREDLDVYSHDLARVCEKYLLAADKAVTYRQQSYSGLMVTTYQEADRIKDLISMFSAYSIKEIESYINSSLITLQEDMRERQRNIIILLFIATVMIISASALFIHYLLAPLHRLIALIRKVSTETWEIQEPPAARNDEMGLLQNVFYDLLNKIKRQFDELLHKQQLETDLLAEREKSSRSEALLAKSELRVFQSQINSHFLFNTLNTVSRLAYLENAPRVQNATNLVSQYLRTTLNQFNRVVTLTEEFTNIESYIEIQKLRFGDRIRFESYMDIEFEWFELPAMTFQPLVENTFRHGVSDKKNGYIKYAAEKENDSLLIYVWDDGKGMSEERRLEILDRLEKNNMDEALPECIGLSNVYQRLCLCYPDKIKPVIESLEGRFCKIGFMISDIY